MIGEYAVPLSLTIIGDLLGVPKEARGKFRIWTEVLIDPRTDQVEQAKVAVVEMEKLFTGLIHAKRDDPADDLISDIISEGRAAPHGAGVSEDELVSLFFLLFWAGYESSVHQIGNGILALLDNPHQAESIRAGAGISGAAVEELLRYSHPSQFAIRRFAVEDLLIGGIRIPCGDTVLLGIASANRDPDRYHNPEKLDLSRKGNPHLAFGHGIHYCLGASLARIEVQVAVESMLRYFPDLQLAVPRSDLQWRASFRERGLRHLPVTLTPVC
ncbi:cytochrome P450 [Nocardia sp. NPDC057272]|uniref:cytochrome P450 n=1 Tax=Nocardia sp. NPDC057272 TaxID=3346079 RepID=UPI00362CCE0F